MRIVQTGSTAHKTVAHGRRRAQPGFSMLELLIASVILGLGLIMVATMFPVALNQHRLSAQQIMATQAALGAKRIVQTHLVPHIDSARNYRGSDLPWLGPTDPRDQNGNGVPDLGEDNLRGPVRWDPLVGAGVAGRSAWHLLHFETIFRDGTVSPWQPDGATYADVLNNDTRPGATARPAWFRIEDTISPPVRRDLASGNLAPGGMSTPSYVWYLFYQRPSPDPTSTDLAYYVAVCRVDGGARFAFRDLQASGINPQPASDVLSRLPIPWLVRVQVPTNQPGVLQESNGSGGTWPGSLRLSQLAPRGSRLLGQTTGTIYTVLASPARGDVSGIDVLPQSNSFDTTVWLFPPPVVMVDGQAVWQPRSPFVTGLQF